MPDLPYDHSLSLLILTLLLVFRDSVFSIQYKISDGLALTQSVAEVSFSWVPTQLDPYNT